MAQDIIYFRILRELQLHKLHPENILCVFPHPQVFDYIQIFLMYCDRKGVISHFITKIVSTDQL